MFFIIKKFYFYLVLIFGRITLSPSCITMYKYLSSIDNSTADNAFGTTLDDALLYFHFYDFFNLLISLWFGIFALKINIAVFRATRFNSNKQGILSSMSGYKN